MSSNNNINNHFNFPAFDFPASNVSSFPELNQPTSTSSIRTSNNRSRLPSNRPTTNTTDRLANRRFSHGSNSSYGPHRTSFSARRVTPNSVAAANLDFVSVTFDGSSSYQSMPHSSSISSSNRHGHRFTSTHTTSSSHSSSFSMTVAGPRALMGQDNSLIAQGQRLQESYRRLNARIEETRGLDEELAQLRQARERAEANHHHNHSGHGKSKHHKR